MAANDTPAVDASYPTPLYHQIYMILRDRILSGEYAYNAVLPGEQDLAQTYGVSRITVKRAMNELVSEGFVSRHRGRGTVVCFKMPSPMVRASFEGLLENLLTMGLKTEVKLIAYTDKPASPAIAKDMDVPAGTPLHYAERVRSLEGEPFSFLATHVPLDIAETFGPSDLQSTPLLALLERAGVKVASAKQSITATLAAPDIAVALGVAMGAPLLKIIRVVKDEDDRPVQHIVAYYRPDRYQYDMSLTRVTGKNGPVWDSSDA